MFKKVRLFNSYCPLLSKYFALYTKVNGELEFMNHCFLSVPQKEQFKLISPSSL